MTWRGAVRAAMIALFLAAAGSTSPTAVGAQDFTCEPGDREVRELEFRGNRAASADDLAMRVRTTPSALLRRTVRIPWGEKRCLNSRDLRLDVAGLKDYYHRRGYYTARIDTLVQPLGKNVVRVVFTIDEGKPIIVRTYDVAGLNGIPDSAEIKNRLRLRVGQPFDNNLYFADLDSIVQRLRNSGYYHADVVRDRLDVNTDSLLAHIGIAVVPGRPARFGEPKIVATPVEGRSQEISNATVLRVMRIRPGDLYSDRAIIESQRNLFQLGAYRHIEIAPDSVQPPGDTIVVLAVRLTEDYMRRLDSEYGWATLDCGKVRLQYSDLNFAKSARRLEVTGQASKIGYGKPFSNDVTREFCTLYGRSPLKADSTFSSVLHYYGGLAIRQPRLLGTRWVPSLSVYSERRGEYKAYLRTTNVGSDLSATRDLSLRTQLRAGYSFEYGRTDAPDAVLCAVFSRCDDSSRVKMKEFLPLGVASASVTRVRTDNVLSPTRGSIIRAEARSSANSWLGTSSSLFFSKGSGDVAWYTALGWRNVLALRLRAGAVVGRRLSDTKNFVPPQERLYAGGPTSVRGFQPNELGELVYIARPSDVRRDTISPAPNLTVRYSVADSAPYERVVPLGGSSLLVGNLEYRIRDPFLFPDLLQYTLFLDAGDVWNRSASAQIKLTPGVAVRVLTGVGPIQINVGYNGHKRLASKLYFEDPLLSGQPISPLYCVSPNNNVDLKLKDGVLQPVTSDCSASYEPARRRSLYQKLTLTFSIGTDF